MVYIGWSIRKYFSLSRLTSHMKKHPPSIQCTAVTAWQLSSEEFPMTKDQTVLLAKAAGVQVITTTSSKEEEAKYNALVVHEVISYWEVPE
ncbi:hypothetical protein RhiTH_011056 [Rhizoctonia solani]